ncbi:cytochrome c-type biogenesis protein [Vibrio parahaemolyticus]|uniref:cytochrome c-type biogenesis protein n=1 Tax=Vibrio parahaemolyticus TaxID=670 RepID=UPI000416252D|nr:cytochrome c-type biogenesis protein [Vibrio parahaemolyticus]TOL08370.1 cytochrome c-type biogenesis protein CcmH [Vibrio parahaemolyticus]HCM0973796.1 cytochrome c-type biogenesis protein CcmH [Vibrio parahaemolyticus]
MRKVILAVFAALTFSLAAHAAIEVYEFDNLEQEQQFKELGHTLRCPKCQNNTISDSNAELAQDLRHKVYEMTKEGKSKEEIVDYMIARYGNFVTYNPPFTMSTAILWLGPLAVILGGFGLIVLRSRKSKAKVTANNDEKWDEQKEERLKALLEEENNGDNK